MKRLRRCEMCGGIAWRGRTEVSVTYCGGSKKIAVNGKEYDSIKVCRKCVNALCDLLIREVEE